MRYIHGALFSFALGLGSAPQSTALAQAPPAQDNLAQKVEEFILEQDNIGDLVYYDGIEEFHQLLFPKAPADANQLGDLIDYLGKGSDDDFILWLMDSILFGSIGEQNDDQDRANEELFDYLTQRPYERRLDLTRGIITGRMGSGSQFNIGFLLEQEYVEVEDVAAILEDEFSSTNYGVGKFFAIASQFRLLPQEQPQLYRIFLDKTLEIAFGNRSLEEVIAGRARKINDNPPRLFLLCDSLLGDLFFYLPRYGSDQVTGEELIREIATRYHPLRLRGFLPPASPDLRFVPQEVQAEESLQSYLALAAISYDFIGLPFEDLYHEFITHEPEELTPLEQSFKLSLLYQLENERLVSDELYAFYQGNNPQEFELLQTYLQREEVNLQVIEPKCELSHEWHLSFLGQPIDSAQQYDIQRLIIDGFNDSTELEQLIQDRSYGEQTRDLFRERLRELE